MNANHCRGTRRKKTISADGRKSTISQSTIQQADLRKSLSVDITNSSRVRQSDFATGTPKSTSHGSPHISAIPRRDDEAEYSVSYDRPFREHLVALRVVLLRFAAMKAEQHAPMDHIRIRARESIEEDVSRIIMKLNQLQGPSPVHR